VEENGGRHKDCTILAGDRLRKWRETLKTKKIWREEQMPNIYPNSKTARTAPGRRLHRNSNIKLQSASITLWIHDHE
jgi:hypothetical protein